MEGSPIEKMRKRISPETKDRVVYGIEKIKEIKRERVDTLMEKIKEKGMQKVHINYILLNSGLPHDFVQGYFTGDEDYFYSADYDPENIILIEKAVNDFDLERDEGKMFPTSSVKKSGDYFKN